MQEFIEAHYGSYTRLIVAPSMRDGRIIREMYTRFVLPRVSHLSPAWPILPDAEYTAWDLFGEVAKVCDGYIHRIAKMVQCEFEPLGFDWLEGLTAESFLNWWLSTEPVPDPNGGDQLLVGLPLIMQLLGDKYRPSTPPSDDDLDLLSEDSDAILLATLCLSFEGTNPTAWDSNYSVVHLNSVLTAAGKLRERAEKAAKEAEQENKFTPPGAVKVEEVESALASDRFAVDRDRLWTALSGFGVLLPDGF